MDGIWRSIVLTVCIYRSTIMSSTTARIRKVREDLSVFNALPKVQLFLLIRHWHQMFFSTMLLCTFSQNKKF